MRPPSYRWIEHGDGPPVVFLSGIFGLLADWEPALLALDSRWRAVVPEIPLFGPVVRKPSIAEIARHVLRFLDGRGIDTAIMGGNSIGGQVAIEIALREPGRVRGLILTGASGIGERRIGKISHRPSIAYVKSQVAQVLDRTELVGPERIEAIRRTLSTPAGVLKALRFSRACRIEGVDARLCDIRVPTLLVWGENDRITPSDVAERFRNGIVGAELVVLPDAAHAPMLEQPIAFAAAVSSWLRRLTPARIVDARSA